MSELREKITAEGRRIWAYAESGATEKYPVPKGPSIDAATNRIMALIAEALLSEQAVEAANSVSVTFHDGEGAVTAALAAAGLGGQGGEQESTGQG